MNRDQFHQKIITGCDFCLTIFFSRDLLQRIHQFLSKKIIAAGDYFWVIGSPDARTFENRGSRPPRFENEVAKIRCFSDF